LGVLNFLDEEKIKEQIGETDILGDINP